MIWIVHSNLKIPLSDDQLRDMDADAAQQLPVWLNRYSILLAAHSYRASARLVCSTFGVNLIGGAR
jgi:hypothetical protein